MPVLPFPRLLSMVADMAVGVASTVVGVVFTAGQAHIRAEEAGPVVGRIRHLPVAMELRVPRVDMQRGRVMAIPGLAAVSRAGINGLETLLLRLLPWLMAAGIHSAGQAATVHLLARNRKPPPQATKEASMFLTETVDRGRAGRHAASRGKETKFTKMLPPREM